MDHEEKLQKAKEFLGSRYLLHPSQRVKRHTSPIPLYTPNQVARRSNILEPKSN